jgi:hypothetical protein
MRIAHYYSGEAPGTSMAGEKYQKGLYQALLDRFQSLEASHARLREQLDELVKQKRIKKEEMEAVASDYDWGRLPGLFTLHDGESLQESFGVHGPLCLRVQSLFWGDHILVCVCGKEKNFMKS